MYIAVCDNDITTAKEIALRIERNLALKGVPNQINVLCDPAPLAGDGPLAYDVLFLDVEMGGWNGIDVAQRIRARNQTIQLVYVSDYIEYAPQGYTVNAFRYLLKGNLAESLDRCLDELVCLHKKRAESLEIKCGSEVLMLRLPDILYIESQKRVLTFHMAAGGRPEHRCYDTIQSMQERLKTKGFLRVHKSYIVNLAHVRQIKNYQVVLDTGAALPASRTGFQELQRVFTLWKGRR